jgi:integrase/recombinase XerD
MSTLWAELDRYLSIRRALGYNLSTSERVLRRFVAFAESEGAEHVGTALFLRWQESFAGANRCTWSRRLGMVRIFAQWLQSIDPKHQVPPQGLLSVRYVRSRPYIYTEDEIRRIVQAATQLPSSNGLRPLTMSKLFGLIAVTGLRISEALSLNSEDVDLRHGVITLRNGKLGKQRLLPVSASTAFHLRSYAAERDRLLGKCPDAFFVSDHGARVTDCSARYSFAMVCQSIGLRAAQRYNHHGRSPRIHDLRHTFAVRTLLNWYREGKDPAREMIKLIAYLGHVKLAHTYWYFEAVPELLDLARRRVEMELET